MKKGLINFCLVFSIIFLILLIIVPSVYALETGPANLRKVPGKPNINHTAHFKEKPIMGNIVYPDKISENNIASLDKVSEDKKENIFEKIFSFITSQFKIIGHWITSLVIGDYCTANTDCSSGEYCADDGTCQINSAVCGNGIIEGSEICDGSDFGGASCESLMGAEYLGILSCNADCYSFDTSSCLASAPMMPEMPGIPELGMPEFVSPGLELPSESMAGMIEGTGNYFLVENSEYLNISIESTANIGLQLTSMPEMVDMYIKANDGSTSTTLTLGGFAPSTTYYKYEDDYHNLIQFITDSEGKYSYTQDLSQEHHVFIQPRPSTKFIKDNSTGGDCALIGSWNSGTKTCTLNSNVGETIQIDNNDVTLDCAGYTITGTNTGYGIYLSSRSGVTIKNCNVQSFTYGIYFTGSSNNTLTGNIANSNNYGVYLLSSSNNNLTLNTANLNYFNGIQLSSSNYNTLTLNTANLNTFYGISIGSSFNNIVTNNIVQENNASDFLISASAIGHCNNVVINLTGSGGLPIMYYNSAISLQDQTLSHLILCNADYSNIRNVTIDGSATLKNNGLQLYLTDQSNFTGVISSDNSYGITFSRSFNNGLTFSTLNSNNNGIVFGSCSYNTIANNTANLNNRGIYLLSGTYNVFTSNNIINSNQYGIYLEGVPGLGSYNNTIYNNFFNNVQNAFTDVRSSPNNWSGNKWLSPNGTGFSEICNDTDGNGVCDLCYTISLGNVDCFSFAMLPTDAIPPETNITFAIDANAEFISDGGISYSSSIAFNFTGTDNVEVAGFECSVDNGEFTNCASLKIISNLNVGSRSFQVRAVDSSGNHDLTPALYSWTINETDADGTADDLDNCPLVANHGQSDANSNGIGDYCEAPNAPGFPVAMLGGVPRKIASTDVLATLTQENNRYGFERRNLFGQKHLNKSLPVDVIINDIIITPSRKIAMTGYNVTNNKLVVGFFKNDGNPVFSIRTLDINMTGYSIAESKLDGTLFVLGNENGNLTVVKVSTTGSISGIWRRPVPCNSGKIIPFGSGGTSYFRVISVGYTDYPLSTYYIYRLETDCVTSSSQYSSTPQNINFVDAAAESNRSYLAFEKLVYNPARCNSQDGYCYTDYIYEHYSNNNFAKSTLLQSSVAALEFVSNKLVAFDVDSNRITELEPASPRLFGRAVSLGMMTTADIAVDEDGQWYAVGKISGNQDILWHKFLSSGAENDGDRLRNNVDITANIFSTLFQQPIPDGTTLGRITRFSNQSVRAMNVSSTNISIFAAGSTALGSDAVIDLCNDGAINQTLKDNQSLNYKCGSPLTFCYYGEESSNMGVSNAVITLMPSSCGQLRLLKSGNIVEAIELAMYEGEASVTLPYLNDSVSAGETKEYSVAPVEVNPIIPGLPSDEIPPVTVKTINDADGDGFEDSFTLTCSDEGKGCSDIRYSINNGEMTKFICPAQGTCSTIVPAAKGSFNVIFYSTDIEGNIESAHSQIEFGDVCPGLYGKFDGCPAAIQSDDDLHVFYNKITGYACIDEKGKQKTNCKLELKLGAIGDSRGEVVSFVHKKIFKLSDLGGSFGAIKNSCREIYDGIGIFAGKIPVNEKDMITNNEIIGVPAAGDYVAVERVNIYDPTDGVERFTTQCKPVEAKDFKNNVAKRKLIVMKTVSLTKNGAVQIELKPADESMINGSLLTIVYPEQALWEEGVNEYVYPYIFTSDSEWSVDICTYAPEGYNIIGVYDENGNLIAESNCAQMFVTGETKVVAFDVVKTGSPAIFNVNTAITATHEGKSSELEINVLSKIVEKSQLAAPKEAKIVEIIEPASKISPMLIITVAIIIAIIIMLAYSLAKKKHNLKGRRR